MRIARKHLGWYTKGLPASGEFRAAVNRIASPTTVIETIRALLPAAARAAGGLTMRRRMASHSDCRPPASRSASAVPGRPDRQSRCSMPLSTPYSGRSATIGLHTRQPGGRAVLRRRAPRTPAAARWLSSAGADSPLLALLCSRCARHGGSAVRERRHPGRCRASAAAWSAIASRPVGEMAWPLTVVNLHERTDRPQDRPPARPARRRALGDGAWRRMLAHEVKNPLSGIRGAAQLLEREPAASRSAS